MKINRLIKISFRVAKLEFKLKNEGTYLGILWYLLHPLAMFPLLLIIFSKNLGENITNYPIYLLLGIIMFNFFQQTTNESAGIISSYKGYIKSIKFPFVSLVASLVLKVLPSHLIEIGFLTILILIFNNSIIGILLYPLILIFFCIFTFSLSLILSSINVYISDIENIWIFGSRFLWIATPIFYSIENNRILEIINLFNPLYFFITIARDFIVYNSVPQFWVILGAIVHSLLFFIVGILIFNKLSKKFAEKVR